MDDIERATAHAKLAITQLWENADGRGSIVGAVREILLHLLDGADERVKELGIEGRIQRPDIARLVRLLIDEWERNSPRH